MRALALAVVLVGCGGGGTPDTFDASPPDSNPTCGEWTVAPAVGTDLRLYDPAPIALGRTVRVAFDVELTGCDDTGIAPVTISVDDATATIQPCAITQIGGTCTGTARTATRVIDLVPPAAGSWTASLATGGDVAFTVGAAPTPACDQTRSPCRADCDCDETVGERCIGVMQGGPTTVCARVCEVDRDCGGDGRCTGDAPGSTPYVCDGQPECDGSHACADGFTCSAGACTPTFTLGQTTRHACSCDADCDAGLRCVRPYDATQPNRCEAMCPTDGPWCEGAHACGELEDDVSGLAGTDSVCGSFGE